MHEYVSYTISLVTILFWVLCFYFTLTFFQQLKTGDERLIKQAKRAAVTSLALALIIPFILTLIMIL